VIQFEAVFPLWEIGFMVQDSWETIFSSRNG